MFTAEEVSEIQLVKASLLTELSQIMKSEQYPAELMNWIVNHGILSGGASASVFHREQPNDYDIYFEDSHTIGHVERFLTLNPYWVKDVKEGYIVQDCQMEGKVWSSRAITLMGNIQLIIMKTSSARSQFDFEHCKPWLHLRTRKYFISEEQYRSIKTRTLIPAPHMIPAQHRIFKFEDRGWKLSDRVQRNPFVQAGANTGYLSAVPVENIPKPPGFIPRQADAEPLF
jgi:hypothetical protein